MGSTMFMVELYRALNMTPIADCEWVGAGPNLNLTRKDVINDSNNTSNNTNNRIKNNSKTLNPKP